MTFASPQYFWLLLVLPLALVHHLRIKPLTIRFPLVGMTRKQGRLRNLLPDLPWWFRFLAWGLIIVALARPQTVSEHEKVSTEGIDIVLTLDISGSMLAMDFKPNRLTAAKKVAGDFVNMRVSDRIGLVLFSSQGYTQCPMTTDYNILQTLISQVDTTQVIDDGTAIGQAIATGVNRLKDSDAKSRIIILLTDGDNNRGIDPLTTAQIAKSMGIKIYTIGVGTQGTAPFPVRDLFGRKRVQQIPVTINEKLLREVADLTGGRYFRAVDNNSLESIYEEINQLEKSKVSVDYYEVRKEYYPWLLYAALVLVFLELLLGATWLRRFP